MAGMDMLTVSAASFMPRSSWCACASARNANEIIEEEETFGERIADKVASFGGSWTFIILFAVILVSLFVHECRAGSPMRGTRIHSFC